MIFKAKKTPPPAAAPKGGDIGTIHKFYKNSNSLELLVNIANALRHSNFIVKCDDIYFTSEYLGDCLAFFNTGLDEIAQLGKMSTSRKEFFLKRLPVRSNPKVELTPKQVLDYVIVALEHAPTKEYESVIQPLKEYREIFLSGMIQEALANVAKSS